MLQKYEKEVKNQVLDILFECFLLFFKKNMYLRTRIPNDYKNT